MESFSDAVKMVGIKSPDCRGFNGNVDLHAAITFCGVVKRKSLRLQC